MLLIREQISSVYRNQSSIPFPHVRVFTEALCAAPGSQGNTAVLQVITVYFMSYFL